MEYTREAFEQTYLIIDKIGQGGGGTALKAYHKRLKKEVVLKRIHSDLKNINTRAETDILKGLKHAYLPQVLDFLEQMVDLVDNSCYYYSYCYYNYYYNHCYCIEDDYYFGFHHNSYRILHFVVH